MKSIVNRLQSAAELGEETAWLQIRVCCSDQGISTPAVHGKVWRVEALHCDSTVTGSAGFIIAFSWDVVWEVEEIYRALQKCTDTSYAWAPTQQCHKDLWGLSNCFMWRFSEWENSMNSPSLILSFIRY